MAEANMEIFNLRQPDVLNLQEKLIIQRYSLGFLLLNLYYTAWCTDA